MTPRTRQNALRRALIVAFSKEVPSAFDELVALYDEHHLRLWTVHAARGHRPFVPEGGSSKWRGALNVLRDAAYGPLLWDEAVEYARTRDDADTTGVPSLVRPVVEAVEAWAARCHLAQRWFQFAVWVNLSQVWPASRTTRPEALFWFSGENNDLPREELSALLAAIEPLRWDPTRQSEEAFRATVDTHVAVIRETVQSRWPDLRARARKDPQHIAWFLRYQALGEPCSRLAPRQGGAETVRLAIQRLSREIDCPLRPGRRPGRRAPQANEPNKRA
jgi:hypothetical protein